MHALALVLLVTLGAAEQSYGPYARPERGGNHSIAAARNGSLLAWIERDVTGAARVHARSDGNRLAGRVVSFGRSKHRAVR